MNDITITIDEEFNNKILTKLKKDNLDIKSYIFNLIKQDLEVDIYIGNGFFLNSRTKNIYLDGKEIKLTKTEYKILYLLIKNENNIVRIEDFQDIWINKMSIFTLRNHVKQIRDKTYIELIKTYYKVGYMLKKASWVNMKSTIPYPKVFQISLDN